MSRFNPFIIEDVAVNAAVSEYVNQTRYSGGVSGLGALAPLLMRKEWHGKCPSGFSPGPVAASGNVWCIPDASAQAGYKLSDEVYSSPPLVEADVTGSDPSEWASWPGTGGSGGGNFLTSIFRNVARTVTGTTEQGGGEPPPPEKKSSPWPWVVGGVAVAGLAVFVLTRRKR